MRGRRKAWTVCVSSSRVLPLNASMARSPARNQSECVGVPRERLFWCVDGTCPTFDVLMQADAFCDLVFAFAHRDRLPDLGQEVFADAFSMNPGGAFNIASTLTRLETRVGWSTV